MTWHMVIFNIEPINFSTTKSAADTSATLFDYPKRGII